MKLVRISCARFTSSGVSCAAISGSAGSMASIENATVAKRNASIAISSPCGSRRDA